MAARTKLGDVARSRPLDDVVESYGIKLTGRPGSYMRQGICPKHNDEDPSFSVYANSQRFYCYGCGWWGDSLDFIRFIENSSMQDATAKMNHLPTNQPARRQPAQQKRFRNPRRDGLVVSQSHEFYVDCLFKKVEGDKGRQFMTSRNISQDTARSLSIGYSTGKGLADYLLGLGFDKKRLCKSGLFTEFPNERFSDMVVVPEMRNGRPVWLTGRATDNERKPRFQAIPGAKPLLGMGTLPKNLKQLVVTEGVFDYITLRQWNIPSLALAGNGNTDRILAELARLQPQSVVFALDADGKSDGMLEHVLQQIPCPTRVAELIDEGSDVADLALIPDGRERFEIALIQARSAEIVLEELIVARKAREAAEAAEKEKTAVRA